MELNLTAKGNEAILYCIEHEQALEFTRVVLGNGQDETGSDVASPLDAFPDGVPVQSPKRTESGDAVELSAVFNNSQMSEADYVTEAGLYIRDPEDEDEEILYAYGCVPYAERTYIPAYAGGAVEIEERFAVYVGTDTEVSVTIASGIYALKHNPEFTGDGQIEGDFTVGGYINASDIRGVNDEVFTDGSGGGGEAKHLDYDAVAALLEVRKLADMGFSPDMVRKLALLMDMHFGEEVDYTTEAEALSVLAVNEPASGNSFKVKVSGEYEIRVGTSSPSVVDTGTLSGDIIQVYPWGINEAWRSTQLTGRMMTICVMYNNITRAHSVVGVGDGSISPITDVIALGNDEYLFPVGTFEADLNIPSARVVTVDTSSVEVMSGGSSKAIRI